MDSVEEPDTAAEGRRARAVPPMAATSTFIPAPLRRKVPDPLFTGRQMPATFIGFVWRLSAWDQVWLTLLAVAVSVLGTVPIDIQRRMVNEAVKQKSLTAIVILASIYIGLVLAQGLLKLLLNMYKGWVSAYSVRLLRTSIRAGEHPERYATQAAVASSQGVEISMVVAEADAVGGYVGESIAEAVLESGILLTVLGYMLLLQPLMAVIGILTFLPQMIFVPIVQRAINRRVHERITMLRAAGVDIIADQDEASPANLEYEQLFRDVFRLDMSIYTLKYWLNFFMNIITHLGTVAMLGIGTWLVVEGRIEVGTVVAFLSGLSNMTAPWGELINWYQSLMVTNTKYQLVRDAAAKMDA